MEAHAGSGPHGSPIGSNAFRRSVEGVPIDLLLSIPQALHAFVSLGGWFRERKRHRMVEQSTEGEAMATKMTVKTPAKAQEYELEKGVGEVAGRINEALKTGQKFVTLKKTDDKLKAFVAADVIAIWEE